MRRIATGLVVSLALVLGLPVSARAEIAEVMFAQQYGTNYLPLMVMEDQKLVEKQFQAKGLGQTKVSWSRLAGPSAIIDAFLTGNVHFAAQGIPSTILAWDRTRTGIGVKAISALCAADIWLMTRNPNVKTLRDLSDKDRLAMPSVKTSSQALFLQMAAEKEFGEGQWGKLDHLAVSMAHPDAVAAMLNPSHEVNGHLATSPFAEIEKRSGLRVVTSLYDAAGGQATGLNFVSTEKFRRENPNTYAAVVAAFDEALDWVNADKRRAAKAYVALANEKKLTADDIYAIISGPDYVYGKTPHKILKSMDLMFRNGTIKTKPVSWKDMYMAEVHGLPGD